MVNVGEIALMKEEERSGIGVGKLKTSMTKS